MDTGSCIVCIKTEDIYIDIATDVEKRLWLMKNEVGEKIMAEFAALRSKTYN